MPSIRLAVLVLAGLFFIFLVQQAQSQLTKSSGNSGAVKLVVQIVFDQLCADYLEKWHDLFCEDGFRRFEREGTWFTNCNYPYSGTFTGPGHASISTGCSPNQHGIVLNEWYDAKLGDLVYCSSQDRYKTVRSVPAPISPSSASGSSQSTETTRSFGATPERLLAPTLGESLKDATGGKGRVVSLSMKDRSAVLAGGKKVDACYWFDNRTGTYCTSDYYSATVAPWVAEFNRGKTVDRWLGKEWPRLRTDFDYAKRSGPDDVPSEGEGIGKKQGRVFPHPMGRKSAGSDREYFDSVEYSAFGNEYLLEFTMAAVQSMKLGQSDSTDLLSVSFSSNDLIGHNYGPDSQEVLDVTLRTDLIVRDLLKFLDKQIGPKSYAICISADHGVGPIPEVAASRGIDAKRLDPRSVANDAMNYLRAKFGQPEDKPTSWIEKEILPWFYLNHRAVTARNLSPETVSEELAAWCRRRGEFEQVYTRKQIESTQATDDELLKMVRKSYHPERCGDVAAIAKPYYLFSTLKYGTSHGSPYKYDRYVPLLVMGIGKPNGRSDESVTPQAVPAILAKAAQIPMPAKAEAPLPKSLKID